MIFQSKKIVSIVLLSVLVMDMQAAALGNPAAAFLALTQNQSCVGRFITLQRHQEKTSAVFRDARDFEVDKKTVLVILKNVIGQQVYEFLIGNQQDLDLLRAQYGAVCFDLLYELHRGAIVQEFDKQHTENILRNYAPGVERIQ